jgi:hypothetical protein
MRTFLVVLALAGAMAFATPAVADHARPFAYPAVYQPAYSQGCAGSGSVNAPGYGYNFPNYWGPFFGNQGLHRGHAYGHRGWSFWPFGRRADQDDRARNGAYNGWGYPTAWYPVYQGPYPYYGTNVYKNNKWNDHQKNYKWNDHKNNKQWSDYQKSAQNERKNRHGNKDQGKNHHRHRHGD